MGRKQCRNHLDNLKSHLSETLVKVRQILTTKASQDGDNSLAELQALLIMPTIEKIKGVLQDLLVCLLYLALFNLFCLTKNYVILGIFATRSVL